MGHEIAFAHTSFKWANLASHNAGVTVVIVGISSDHQGPVRKLFSVGDNGRNDPFERPENINAYLVSRRERDREPSRFQAFGVSVVYMTKGNHAY